MKVLVVEDNPDLATCVGAALDHFGHEAVHAASIEQALARIETDGFDAAILDVDLSGDKSTPVAVALSGKRIPYIVATAHRAESTPVEMSGHAHLQKPYPLRDLERALSACASKRA